MATEVVLDTGSYPSTEVTTTAVTETTTQSPKTDTTTTAPTETAVTSETTVNTVTIPAETAVTTTPAENAPVTESFDFSSLLSEYQGFKENLTSFSNDFSIMNDNISSIRNNSDTFLYGALPIYTAAIILIALGIWFYKTFIK